MMSYNICTIITDNWVDAHLVRWLRYASKYCPDARKYLFYIGKDLDGQFPGISDEFAGVAQIDEGDRPEFNRIRMSATSYFGVKDIIYCDADADILADLGHVCNQMRDEGKTLGCVESPALHSDWRRVCQGKEWPMLEANNGFLYLADDWGDRYEEAVKKIEEYNVNPRIKGTIAFNQMLKDNSEWGLLDYSNSVIWWDMEKFIGAKCIQYCNNQGQAKRIALEEEYRASRVPEEAE